jgi:hypothetical protein
LVFGSYIRAGQVVVQGLHDHGQILLNELLQVRVGDDALEGLLCVPKHLGIVIVQKLAVSIYKLYKFSRLGLFNSRLLGLYKVAQLVNHFDALAPIRGAQVHQDVFEIFHEDWVNGLRHQMVTSLLKLVGG